MSARFRTLLAALAVAITVLAAAAYIGARAVTAQAPQISVNLDDAGALGSQTAIPPVELFAKELVDLQNDYYKPFEPQTPFRGEAEAITKYLQSNHVAHPVLPSEIATGDPNADAQRLASVVAYADRTYGAHLQAGGSIALTQAALSGVMDSVDDPYTVYLTPRQIQSLNESLKGGDFGGIGVYIIPLKDGETALQPIDGLPAAQAGMKPGEIVDTVDGRAVRGEPADIVEHWIRGAEGTRVVLTTHPYKKKTEHRYAIVRQIIHVPTVEKKMEDGYEYIRLTEFGQTSADEIKNALLYGRAHNAKGFILDLRYNGGGLVSAAIDISSYFIPHGTIVSTIDREGHRQVEEALGDAIASGEPLVILVNRYTASASEITAGALQDYHAATLVGTKTFGKGVIQSIYDMPDGGALKITTERYLTPLGREIQHKGIMPDVIVPQSDDVILDSPGDKQLAAAKAQLKKLLQ